MFIEYSTCLVSWCHLGVDLFSLQFCVCMFECECMFVYLCVGVNIPRSQKKVPDSIELESQVVVSFPIWML